MEFTFQKGRQSLLQLQGENCKCLLQIMWLQERSLLWGKGDWGRRVGTQDRGISFMYEWTYQENEGKTELSQFYSLACFQVLHDSILNYNQQCLISMPNALRFCAENQFIAQNNFQLLNSIKLILQEGTRSKTSSMKFSLFPWSGLHQ